MSGTVKAIPSVNVPVGHCIVLVDDKVVYMGRIRGAVHYLVDDVELYLNPYDFSDGSAFMERHGGLR